MPDISDFVDYFIPEKYRGEPLPHTHIRIPPDATGMFVDELGTLQCPKTWVSFYDRNRFISKRIVHEFKQDDGVQWRIKLAADYYLDKNENSINPMYTV
jgi:hypothetical protein